MEKITKREMYEALISLMEKDEMTFERDGEIFEVDKDTMSDFAAHEIDLLDKKASKAKERAASKKNEVDELGEAVFTALSDTDFEPIADIAARIEGDDVTISKVTYRLTQLVKAGEAEKQELTIPATETSKSRKVQGYRLVTETAEPANLESAED